MFHHYALEKSKFPKLWKIIPGFLQKSRIFSMFMIRTIDKMIQLKNQTYSLWIRFLNLKE